MTGLLDAALLPGAGLPDDERGGRRSSFGRRLGRVARAVGAILLWLTAESLFLLPDAPPRPDLPAAAWYRPLVPPAWGALLNVGVAAAFVWWFARRPGARRDPRRRATFRLRAPAAGTWPWVAAAALAAAVAVNAATLVLPRFLALPRDVPLLEVYARFPGAAFAMLALAALVAPLLEEFFFRGWLQGALERRLAPWTAVLATAAVFAAAHGGELFGLTPRFALAVAAGYAAWRTRSIWPSVALHGAYNAALFAGGALLPAVLPKPPAAEAWTDADRAAYFFWAHDARVFPAALVALAGAAALVAWALRRATRGSPAADAGTPDPGAPGDSPERAPGA